MSVIDGSADTTWIYEGSLYLFKIFVTSPVYFRPPRPNNWKSRTSNTQFLSIPYGVSLSWVAVSNLFSGIGSNPSGPRPILSPVAECIIVDASVCKLWLWWYLGFKDSLRDTGHSYGSMTCTNPFMFEFLFFYKLITLLTALSLQTWLFLWFCCVSPIRLLLWLGHLVTSVLLCLYLLIIVQLIVHIKCL